jgi:hypothetical protein
MVHCKTRFLLLIAMIFLASMCQPQAPKPYLTVDELLRDASLHNRTIVTVSGWLHSGWEYGFLQPDRDKYPSQNEAIWLDDIELVKANEQRWPEMKNDRATTEPTLSPAGQELYRKYRRLCPKYGAPPFIVPVILRGEFQTSDTPTFNFEHYHRLIVYEVISIGPKQHIGR